MRALSTLGASPLLVHARLLELAAGTARCPFDAFLDAVQEPMRLLFDPTFAPAEGAFLGVLEACAAGNETAVVAAALLLGVSFPVDEDDQDDQDDQEDKTRVFEVDATDNEGNTPLLIAIRTRQARCPRTMRGLCGVVELLLAAGATVAAKNEDGFTALMLACVEKKEEAAALLTEATKNAAALDVQDTKYKRSALHYASSSGLESIVAKLLSLGADVALKDKAGNTAVERAQNAQTIEVLKGAGATMPEFPEEKKNDLLIQYAEKGLAGGALMALQAGADVNHEDRDSWTALHHAAYKGHEAVAQGPLLGAGADVNAKDGSGRTPLHLAAWNNKPEVAKVLLAHGAQVNARNDYSATALHHAAYNGYEALAQGLLGAGAEVNATNVYSKTALHNAAENGHEALAQGLLGAGADVNAKDEDGETPLHLAATKNKPEVAKVLLAHGAQVNARTNGGGTALEIALYQGHPEMVALLLLHIAE